MRTKVQPLDFSSYGGRQRLVELGRLAIAGRVVWGAVGEERARQEMPGGWQRQRVSREPTVWPCARLLRKQGPSGEGAQDLQGITERQDEGHVADDEREPGVKICKGYKAETVALLGDWKTDEAETWARG